MGCQSYFTPTSGQEQLNLDKTLFGCSVTHLFLKIVNNNSLTASGETCSRALTVFLSLEILSNVRLVIFFFFF